MAILDFLQHRERERPLARIAFLLLCHKRPDRVLEQVRVLTSAGDFVAIHPDLNAGPAFSAAIRKGIADNPRAVVAKQVRCGWGEWSLVRASLNMAEAAMKAFGEATHFFLMSGDCMPIKPVVRIRAALEDGGQDWIEHADFFEGGWIKTGLIDERVTRRHYFNERTQKRWFYGSLELQRRLKLERQPPKGIKLRIGSQWWALRRDTMEKLLAFVRERRDVVRFFKTTWIPDETFFQTLVMHLVPRQEVISRPPTYLIFSDYGMPVTFAADHFELLRAEDAFLARKISDHDDALRARLGDLFLSDEEIPAESADGRALYDFIRARGRLGRRFGPRAWEEQGQLGRGRRVSIVVCKKWHVAKRLMDSLRAMGGPEAFDYVFDEDEAGLPELGNLEGSREKRGLHRRAFLSVLFSHLGKDHIAFCLDPANLSTVTDLREDGCALDVLYVECAIDRDWLEGHAERVGLGSRAEAGALHGQLLGALERTVADEAAALRDAGVENYGEIAQGQSPGEMARVLSRVFGLSIDDGARLARTENLFD